MSETVQIKDSEGTWLKLEISTANSYRLTYSLSKTGNGRMFRPGGFWSGDWSASDKGLISCNKGNLWYKRASGDIWTGNSVSNIQHIDIFLFKDGEGGEDDWAIKLNSFISLNGSTSSGGGGYISQAYALQIKPGSVSWDCRERLKSP